MTHNITIVLDLHFSSVCDICHRSVGGAGPARSDRDLRLSFLFRF